jgi:hypothetical protein
MIKPTIAQVVWLYGARGVNLDLRKPFAVDIAFVWSDRMLNVGYLDHLGQSRSLTSVVLLQDDDLKPEGQPFCTWMPFQVGQANARKSDFEIKV